MTITFLKKLILIFVVGNLLLLIVLLKLKSTPKPYHPNLLKESYNEITLYPSESKQIIINTDIPFLYADIAPSDKKYPLVVLKEEYDLKKNKYTLLSMASKRISELERWREQIPIIDCYKNIEQFKSWWKETKPASWHLLNNSSYNSWESVLGRYMELVDRRISQIDSKNNPNYVSDFTEVSNYIETHKEKLDRMIVQLQLQSNEKAYLQTMVDDIFAYYRNYISQNVPVYNPQRVFYSLNSIVTQGGKGLYDVKINSSFVKKDMRLLYDKTTVLPYTNVSGDPLSQFSITSFRNVTIDGKTDDLMLELPLIDLALYKNWSQNKKTKDKFEYFIDIPLEKPLNKYLIQLTHHLNDSAIFRYELLPTDLVNNKFAKVYKLGEKFLLPSKTAKKLQKHIQFLNPQNSLFTRYVIISNKPLSTKQLLDTRLSVIPIFEPNLSFERRRYLSDYQPNIEYKKENDHKFKIHFYNIGEHKKNHILQTTGFGWEITQDTAVSTDYRTSTIEFWPRNAVIKLLVLFNVLLLIPTTFTFYLEIIKRKKQILALLPQKVTLTVDLIKNNSHSLLQTIRRLLVKYRLFTLLVFIINLLINLLIKPNQHFSLLSEPTIFSLLVIVSYSLDSVVYFFTSLLFIFLTVILYILGLERISEKLASWSYLFLCLGIVHLFIQKKLKIEGLHTINTFKNLLWDDIRNFPQFIPEPIKKKLIVAFEYIKNLWIEIYGPFPVTKKQRYVLGIKLVITSLIIFIVYYIFFTVNHALTRNSRNPIISHIEPKIVYHSTKVVIKGGGFGWKQNEKVKLNYQGGEVMTDYWTNDKIIFTVPLHWEPGAISLWIERPTLWDDKFIIAKSKLTQIKLIPIGSRMTPDDDAYFEQLKDLSAETLRLNGHDR